MKYWRLLQPVPGILIISAFGLQFVAGYYEWEGISLALCRTLGGLFLIVAIGVLRWIFKNEPEKPQQPKGDVLKEIEITGFDEEYPPVLRVLDNHTTYLIFEIFPPENGKLTDNQIDNLQDILSVVTGVEVIHEDRELFIIFSDAEKVIEKVVRFFGCFDSFSFQPISRLSQRANDYMSTLYYYTDEWTCDREMISQYFNSQNFPLFEAFIDFQLHFSGYTLTLTRDEVKKDGRHAFDLRLFCKSDIVKGSSIYYEKEGNDYWLDCGYHHAPFHFYMNQKGEIAVLDGDDFQIICSSYLKFVEQYALDNKYFYEYGYYGCADTRQIQEYMSQNQYTIIPECSDRYSTFYTNGEVVVKNGTFLGSSRRYLYLLTNSKQTGVEEVEKMKYLITNELDYPIKSIQEIMAPIEAKRGY
ncbi:MAG: hypothetical protein LUH10_07355 [Tannerellaceae bacterium]|nr:hypothetical protein [Tannerellaceae bacterium]